MNKTNNHRTEQNINASSMKNQPPAKLVNRKEHTATRIFFTIVLLTLFFLASFVILLHDKDNLEQSSMIQELIYQIPSNPFESMFIGFCVMLTEIELFSFDKIIILATLFSLTLIFLYTIYGIFPKTSEYQFLPEFETTYWEAFRRKNIWLCFSNIWQIIYYWSHSASLFTTLIIVYITLYNSNMIEPEEQLQRIVLYSLISTALGFMDIYIAPKKIVQGYRKAYECIDKGITKSIFKKNIDILTKARLKGEKIIGKLSFPKD